jgi:hypothetical protein
MSRILEMPDAVYSVLQHAAQAEGTTPVGWISSRLPADPATQPPASTTASPRTLADLFAGRVGTIGSGGKRAPSEKGSEEFGEYLQAKKRGGQL